MTQLAAARGATGVAGVTPGQIALAWLLAQHPWVVPISGTRRIERLDENAGATGAALAADDVADLDGIVARLGVRGDPYNEVHMGYVGR